MISPTLYARVVAKMPEAKVPGIVFHAGKCATGTYVGSAFYLGNRPYDDAAALILRHWLGMLPEGYGLQRTAHKNGWCVVYFGHEADAETDVMPTPEEALAEWLMSRSGE